MDGFFTPKHKCPDCGKLLVAEESIPEGMAWKSAWDSIYNFVFAYRRQRFICLNKECPSYYYKNIDRHTRFVQSLTPGVMVEEHFLNESIKTRGQGKKKNRR